MDLFHKQLVFITLFIVGVQCERNDILEQTRVCLHNILPEANIEDITSSPIPIWTISKFKQVCGKLEDFDLCINAIPKNPQERALEIVKEMLQKKIDFLCGLGSNYYIHNKDCLAKDDIQDKVTACTKTFVKKFDRKSKNIKLQCTIINEFRHCVENSAKICGSEAKSLVATYMDFNVESYTGLPYCKEGNNGFTQHHIGLMALLLNWFVMILLIV